MTVALLAVNAVVMGFFTFSFAQGPYSSVEQELWYRWVSIAFFVGGVVFPAGLAAIRPLTVKRNRMAMNIWLAITLFAFFAYLFSSGGGV